MPPHWRHCAERENSRNADAYFSRGIAYRNKDEHDRAIADYNKAIEIDPKLAAAYRSRGNAYADKGEYDRAIMDYTKAIEIDPKDELPTSTAAVTTGPRVTTTAQSWTTPRPSRSIRKKAMTHSNRCNAYSLKSEYDRAILESGRPNCRSSH